MPSLNLLVIAVDGLRASALGAYGNTWYRTTTLDRIAAQSVLCDWFFADSTDLRLLYRGLWQSRAALRTGIDRDDGWSLPGQLSKLGYATRLVTDAQELADFAATQHFAEAVLLKNQPATNAEAIEQTCAADVVAEVISSIEELHRSRQPWFIWAHLNGLYGAWDAPQELALSLVEEGDAIPQPSIAAPFATVHRDSQADEIFAQSCRYAAQVMALDFALEPLLDLLDGGAAGDCLLVLLGTRGFPLGEHGQLGGCDWRLYSEQLHAPLLTRLPGGKNALARISWLVHPADLSASVLGAVNSGSDPIRDGLDYCRRLDNACEPWRTFLLAAGPGSILSIRTPAWYLRGISQPTESTAELFVKPYDRWEINDVANLCPEVAAELAEVALGERERIAAGEPMSLAVLPSELVEPPS